MNKLSRQASITTNQHQLNQKKKTLVWVPQTQPDNELLGGVEKSYVHLGVEGCTGRELATGI